MSTRRSLNRIFWFLFPLLLLPFFGMAQTPNGYPLGVSASTQDLASDNNGVLHLIWVGASNYLYYGKIVPNGTGGYMISEQQTITQLSGGATANTRPRMAVRPDGGSVHIVYLQSSVVVKHAWRVGAGSWNVESIRDNGNNYAFVTIGVGMDESVHFVGQKWSLTQMLPVVYAKKPAGGAWPAGDIALSPTDAEYRDCAVFTDPAGGIHASWHSAGRPGYYRYAPPGTGLDTATTLEIPKRSGINTNAFGDLFVKANGEVHTAMSGWTGSSTTVEHSIRPAGGVWQTPTAATNSTTFPDNFDSWPAVVADATKVYTAWPEGYTLASNLSSQVYFSVKQSGTWTMYTVDTNAAIYGNAKVSLAITPSGVFGVWRSNYFAAGQLALGVIPGAPGITVTSPNGGESWAQGSTHNITWTANAITGNVTIDLYKNGALSANLGTAAATAGTFSWTIPGSQTVGSDYKVRIYQGSYEDYSDANFSVIVPPPATITVTSPNGGESWQAGIQRNITWTQSGLSGNVTIDLYKGTTLVKNLGTAAASAGTCACFIPASAVAGTDYKVRIWQGSVEDYSNSNFSVTAAVLIITTPNGGESWLIGSTQRINWTTTISGVNCYLYLFKGDTVIGYIGMASITDRVYSWTVGNYTTIGTNQPGAAVPGSDYRIALQCNYNSTQPTSFSDNYFTLTNTTAPTITVTSPNGGESWQTGSSHSVTWTQSGITGNVTIELWKGTSLDSTLGTAAASAGSLSWTISTGQTIGSDYKVRVYQGSYEDYSNANFSVVTPPTGSITVTSPNGGESWQAGIQRNITWTQTGLSGNVTIDLYKNSVLVKNIGTAAATAGTCACFIPASAVAGSDYKVRIWQGSVEDYSNSNFTVTAAVLIITTPNGGESWLIGSTQRITWTTTISGVNCYLYLSKGDTVIGYIGMASITDRAYSWTVGNYKTLGTNQPATAVAGSDYKIALQCNYSSTQPTSFSDNYFTLTTTTTSAITVTSPNGGESWQAGIQRNITWTQTGLSGNVTIDLYKNGVLVKNIGTAAATAGTCACFIPASAVAGSDYKVRIWQGSVEDYSNSNFSVTAASLIITTPNGGENWHIGSTQTITWTTTISGVNCYLYLSKGGTVIGYIGMASITNHAYSWTVGNYKTLDTNQPATAVAGSDYKIALQCNYNGTQPTSFSDNYFTLSTTSSAAAIMWYNDVDLDKSGQILLWYLNPDGSIKEQKTLNVGISVGWKVGAVADMDGDGNIDVVMRGPQGQDQIRYLNAEGAVIRTLELTVMPDLGWRICGVGDFNGDKVPDIVWRDYSAGSPGTNMVWCMSAAGAIVEQKQLASVADLNWTLVGVGDFDKDGMADLVWRYVGTGADQGRCGVALLNADGAKKSWLELQAETDLNWRIGAVADFDGDGNLDVVWRNYGSGLDQGQNRIWYLNVDGSLRAVQNIVPMTDTNWRIVNDGDGSGN